MNSENPNLHEGPIELPIGSLESLCVLEHLSLPRIALFGMDDEIDDDWSPSFVTPRLKDILPKSLESLELSRCDFDLEILQAAITDLVENWEHPELSLIRFKGYFRVKDFAFGHL